MLEFLAFFFFPQQNFWFSFFISYLGINVLSVILQIFMVFANFVPNPKPLVPTCSPPSLLGGSKGFSVNFISTNT